MSSQRLTTRPGLPAHGSLGSGHQIPSPLIAIIRAWRLLVGGFSAKAAIRKFTELELWKGGRMSLYFGPDRAAASNVVRCGIR